MREPPAALAALVPDVAHHRQPAGPIAFDEPGPRPKIRVSLAASADSANPRRYYARAQLGPVRP